MLLCSVVLETALNDLFLFVPQPSVLIKQASVYSIIIHFFFGFSIRERVFGFYCCLAAQRLLCSLLLKLFLQLSAAFCLLSSFFLVCLLLITSKLIALFR